jgi:hypothetical protein
MRDLKKEEADSAANVASSARKVDTQERLISEMDAHNPDMASAKHLLGQMRQSEASARTNHAMIEYDSEDRT